MSTFTDEIASGKYDKKMWAAVVSAFNAGQSATHAVALWAAWEAQRETAERCAEIAGESGLSNREADWTEYAKGMNRSATTAASAIRTEFLTTEKEANYGSKG